MHTKRLAGEYAVDFIKEGMTIGLGTGSTVYWTIQKLGELVREGLAIGKSNGVKKLISQNK